MLVDRSVTPPRFFVPLVTIFATPGNPARRTGDLWSHFLLGYHKRRRRLACAWHWVRPESCPAGSPRTRPCAWRSSASPRARLLRLDVNDLGSILRKLRFRIRPGCPGSLHAGTLGNRRLRCGGSSSDCEMFPEHKGPLPPVQLHFFLQGFGHSGRPTGLVPLAPRCCIRALEPTSVLRPHRESFRGSRSFRAGTRSHSCRHTQWAESHHRLSI